MIVIGTHTTAVRVVHARVFHYICTLAIFYYGYYIMRHARGKRFLKCVMFTTKKIKAFSRKTAKLTPK